MKKILKIIFKAIIFVTILFGVGVLNYRIGVLVGEENILKTPPLWVVNQDFGQPEDVNFSIFWETWRKLERNFFEKGKIDYQKMIYGAVSGMVKALDDPYTVFFTPQETEDFNEELSGKYEGVGMVVGMKDEQLTVISPLKGTPADKAGLKPGDKILKIEETYTADISIDRAVQLIKGPNGTDVRLLIQRKSQSEPKEIKIRREIIKIPTLEWELLTLPGERSGEEGSVALIKIYQFNQILSTEFEKSALEILNSPAQKIIIDLRNNPGGYLETAQEVAGWFLKKGSVVTWQDMGEGKEMKAYRAEGTAAFLQYPTVVLINKGSASGAEILAGALRDQREIKLIGETSFGKGSVQEQINLSDSSSLKVTMSKWLTPDGNSIDKEGLEPDIKVAASDESDEIDTEDEEEDIQLKKALEIIKDLE